MTNLTVGRTIPKINIFNDVESLFDSVIRDTFNTVTRSPIGTTLKKASYPKIDVRDTTSSVIVDATVPGLSREDISIEYEDGFLKVSAEKQQDLEGEFTHREIHRSSFARWFAVESDIYNVENISASVDKGILSIVIPKREEAKKPLPRKIEVK